MGGIFVVRLSVNIQHNGEIIKKCRVDWVRQEAGSRDEMIWVRGKDKLYGDHRVMCGVHGSTTRKGLVSERKFDIFKKKGWAVKVS